MKYKLPKTLVLDIKKWVCGAESSNKKNKVGKGISKLQNSHGYMCCLGQFCKQANPDIDISNYYSPSDIPIVITGLNRPRKKDDPINYLPNRYTKLSDKSMKINDNTHTLVTTKIKQLQQVLKSASYKLKIINKKYLP